MHSFNGRNLHAEFMPIIYHRNIGNVKMLDNVIINKLFNNERKVRNLGTKVKIRYLNRVGGDKEDSRN